MVHDKAHARKALSASKTKSKAKMTLAVDSEGVGKKKKSGDNEIAFKSAIGQVIKEQTQTRTTDPAKKLINMLLLTGVRILTQRSTEVMASKKQHTVNEICVESACGSAMGPRMAARAIKRGRAAIKKFEQSTTQAEA